MKHLFDRLTTIIQETERIDTESPVPEGEPNPALQPLFEEGTAIVRQLDPLLRERFSDQPEKLAEWARIQCDYARILAEGESARAKREAEAAKESEGLKLAADIGAVMDRVSADLDRFSALDGPDLEVEAMLERSFAALHELDFQMRVRGRDFPEQLEKWKVIMAEFEEVEARFERGRKLEESEPAN
jgi:hypothetical protein